jgi:murein DD-endopeptidase MepM/ murein hydrolase activator NlpD
MSMGRRQIAAALLVLGLLASTPALGDPGADKARVDERIGSLRGQIDTAHQEEGVLTSEISAASEQIRAIQAGIDAEETHLAGLESRLAASRAHLEELTDLLARQTEQLQRLRRQHQVAVERLERRVRQIYIEETPDALSFVLGAASFSDLLDHVELLNDIGKQDARIAERVERAEREQAEARRQTEQTRTGVAAATRTIEAEVDEQRALRDRLVASRDALATAVGAKQDTLASIRHDKEEFLAEVAALEAESASLAAAIEAAQAARSSAPSTPAPAASSGSGVSAAGFVWPVSGAVVSGFGMRWGRMHEGIDITCASGTPVVAAAAGTVIHAGWLGGYGNLVVVDHGNGLSTAYAHNSSFAVGVGQTVAQGEVISYSGSTGNSSGPHVHFEVRVNGSAVDPLGYL